MVNSILFRFLKHRINSDAQVGTPARTYKYAITQLRQSNKQDYTKQRNTKFENFCTPNEIFKCHTKL